MKRKIVLLSLIMVVFLFTSCASDPKVPDRELAPPPSAAPAELEMTIFSPVTSKDAELYVARDDSGGNRVVNRYRMNAAEYTVDKNGNIVSGDGAMVVSHDHVAQFEEIASLHFSDDEYTVSLSALNLPTEYTVSGQYSQNTVPFRVSLEISNPEATNQVVLLESSAPEVITVHANRNAELIAEGAFEVGNNCLAVQPKDPAEPMVFTVSAKTVGDAVLTARALSGTASAECMFHVVYGEGDSSGVEENWQNCAAYNTAAHVHQFSRTVQEPTRWENGFTLFTCEECGYSYKGEYTPRLPDPGTETAEEHVHQYTESVVAPTDTERGYTLYTCQECGDSYKTNYVQPTGLTSQDTNPDPQHVHSFTATAVPASCTEGGYTLYSCACGESYRADETAALGHDWTMYSESERAGQEAHEICGDCGLDLTANGITGADISAHAKNHVLSDDNASGRTYTAMVDVYQDVTKYVCSRCGARQ